MTSKPNVLFVVMDTARKKNFSCYGYARKTTATVDQLAKKGIMFTNAISASPWTFPSHTSMFTGNYPSSHGAHEKNKFYDGRTPTMAEFFAENGYCTVAINANTWISDTFGLNRGFNDFYKMWQVFQSDHDLSGISLDASSGGKQSRIAMMLRRIGTGNVVKNAINVLYARYLFKRKDYAGQRIAKCAIRWLTNWKKEAPFFMFINFVEPHLEYKPPKGYKYLFAKNKAVADKFLGLDQIKYAWQYVTGKIDATPEELEELEALYDAEITYTDSLIQKIVTHLTKNGELENTIIVITADHGENIGEHHLMDHQYCIYDTLINVPLIIHYPDKIPAGQVEEKLAQSVDLFPTLINLAGLDRSRLLSNLPGIDLLSEEQREFAISEYLGPQPTLPILKRFVPQLSDEELARYDRALRSIRTQEWKYIWASDGNHELYNIQLDPSETNNTIGEHVEVAQMLQEKLDEWVATATDRGIRVGREGPEIDDVVRRQLEALGYM